MKERGFTLIELLVTIAIIGILSSIVFSSLGGSRDKAQSASVLSTLKSIQSVANICIVADGIDLNDPDDAQNGGGEICDTTLSEWPELISGWTYGTVESDQALGTFEFSASDGTETVTCNHEQCERS